MSTLADDLKATAVDLGRQLKFSGDASNEIKDVDAAIRRADAFQSKKK
jgi:hypothetical protein